MKKRPKKQNTKAIERLAGLLPDVLEAFGEYDIGLSKANAGENANPEADEAEPDEESNQELEQEELEEEEFEEPEYYYDPADVQGALYEAISTLVKEGVIKGFRNPKKPPTLARILEALFGPQSDLAERASYFEDLISGYEDRAHIDDLREARGVLDEIIEALQKVVPED
jgi:hypothetical protein